jgi:4-amino-4-deoxy-L-arabinose transferase-like glycosyltransferase
VALLAAVALTAVGMRLTGASALYRFDQPRTAAYTADVAYHGRWLLPRDMQGHLATKPPLVNWLGAPPLWLGLPAEFAVKTPMLLGGLATLALTAAIGYALLRRAVLHEREHGSNPLTPKASEDMQRFVGPLSVSAALMWLAASVNLHALYHCRPDPFLLPLMIGAWWAATRVLECAEAQRVAEASGQPTQAAAKERLRWAWGFWTLVGLAALTKGPPALAPVLYLVLACWWLHGRWGLLGRSGIFWGLPWALLIVGWWLAAVTWHYPGHAKEVFLGQETLGRILGYRSLYAEDGPAGQGPIMMLTTLHQMPLWFIDRFLPWSLLALGAMIRLVWLGPRRHPMVPAALWVLVVLAFFSLTGRKTADYIWPAYPAAAILAAWLSAWLLSRWLKRPPLSHRWLMPMNLGLAALAVSLAAMVSFFSTSSEQGYGRNLHRFAAEVRSVIGQDRLAYVNVGYNNLDLLLRRPRTGDSDPDQIAQAQWLICPPMPEREPELISKTLPNVAYGRKHQPGRLALYRLDDQFLAPILPPAMSPPAVSPPSPEPSSGAKTD